MSASKQPSFVAIDQIRGTATVAYLTSWYHEDRCDDCPRFHRLDFSDVKMGYCELLEKDKPCEITGVGPEGERK